MAPDLGSLEGEGDRPLQILGRGTISTVYKLDKPDDYRLSPGRQLAIKAGHNCQMLRSEFQYARDIYRLSSTLARSTRFLIDCGQIQLPLMPLYMQFYCPEDGGFWDGLENKLEAHDRGMAGIVMDRIPPLPSAVGKMLIKRYFDENDVDPALSRREHENFLVRLHYGRVCADFDTRPAPTRQTLGGGGQSNRTPQGLEHECPTLATLADMPAPLSLLKAEVPLRSHRLVASIAAGYALLHWGCFVDGNGTEFVLGGGDSIRVWMLDFDKCLAVRVPLQDDDDYGSIMHELIHRRFVPAVLDGGYTPHVGEETFADNHMDLAKAKKAARCINSAEQTLWETWRDAYIAVGEYCAEHNHSPHLRDGPAAVCDALELAFGSQSMGLSSDADMIVFADDEGEEEAIADLGWGSDDGDVEDDDEEDEDEQYDSEEDEDAGMSEGSEADGTARPASRNEGSSSAASTAMQVEVDEDEFNPSPSLTVPLSQSDESIPSPIFESFTDRSDLLADTPDSSGDELAGGYRFSTPKTEEVVPYGRPVYFCEIPDPEDPGELLSPWLSQSQLEPSGIS